MVQVVTFSESSGDGQDSFEESKNDRIREQHKNFRRCQTLSIIKVINGEETDQTAKEIKVVEFADCILNCKRKPTSKKNYTLAMSFESRGTLLQPTTAVLHASTRSGFIRK